MVINCVLYNERMLFDLARPIIIAHRGAAVHAPENTIVSFELAVSLGADAIELDAKLSADGEIVVFHDATLERTTNGSGRLSRKTLSELRTLDAGYLFSSKYRGEKIPLLEEVFEAVGKKTFINIELTNYTTPGDALVEKVCTLVKTCGMERRVIFSSFLPSNLWRAARLLPDVPRGLLAAKSWKGAWARSFGFTFGEYASLHPFLTDVDAQQVRRVHRLRRRIHVWSVNEAEQITRLTEWEVDGIFTKDPRLALATLGRQK